MNERIITFDEVFTIPENFRSSAVQRISHLVNFGSNIIILYEFGNDYILFVDMIRIFKTYNSKGRIWIVYDDYTTFVNLIMKLVPELNPVLIDLNNIEVMDLKNNDLIIFLLEKHDVNVLSKIIKKKPSTIIVGLKNNIDEQDIEDWLLLKLYSNFSTYLIKDLNTIKIYELKLKELQKFGFELVPLYKIGGRKNQILLLYDNYTTFVKVVTFILSELKKGNEVVYITSPNLPLIQRYIQLQRIIKRYNIKFLKFESYLNQDTAFKKIRNSILIVEHPYPDIITIKKFENIKKYFTNIILASNSISLNLFIKSLLSNNNINSMESVNKFIELFNTIIKTHMEYTSSNNLIIECYTKLRSTNTKDMYKILKLITKLDSDIIIKTVNQSIVAKLLENLGWTNDLLQTNKNIILIEPSEKIIEAVKDRRKIIITTTIEKYMNLEVPIIINLDKLLKNEKL